MTQPPGTVTPMRVQITVDGNTYQDLLDALQDTLAEFVDDAALTATVLDEGTAVATSDAAYPVLYPGRRPSAAWTITRTYTLTPTDAWTLTPTT